jgi:hypothetical protein
MGGSQTFLGKFSREVLGFLAWEVSNNDVSRVVSEQWILGIGRIRFCFPLMKKYERVNKIRKKKRKKERVNKNGPMLVTHWGLSGPDS